MDRLKKLRAWIYLNATRKWWAAQYMTDAEVLGLPEEKLKLVAIAVVISVGREQGTAKALELAGELEWEIGYSPEELRAAKAEFEKILAELT